MKPWLILPPWSRYGVIALAVIVMAGSSQRCALRAGQNANADKTVGTERTDDDKAVQDFLSDYQLAPGQNLKRIEPPRPAGAAIWWKRKFRENAGAGPERYAAMIFRFCDPADLENYSGLLGRGGQGYAIRNIPEAIGMDVGPAEIEGDRELLTTNVAGDWVFRDRVPADRMARSLESILQRVLRRRIQIALRPVERDVVVARGQYHHTPLPGRSRNQVDLYGSRLVPSATAVSVDFRTFLKKVGRLIGRPVVDQVEAAPKEPIVCFEHVRTPSTEETQREDHDEAQVLAHLHEQTGLALSREMKLVRVLFVEPAE